MTGREIANLCCRVLAIYAILQGVGRLSSALSLLWPLVQHRMPTGEATLGAIMGAGEPILWLAAGAFLWRWSGLIAAWMIGTDLHDHRKEPEPVPQVASSAVLHAIAFSTVGVWVLADALPRIVGDVVQLIGIRYSPEPLSAGQAPAWIAAMTEHATRLALGLYLLFGASGLVGLLRRLKDIGLAHSDAPRSTP